MAFDVLAAMAACSTCPKMCRHVCPTAELTRRESRTPTAKSAFGWMWESGVLTLDGDVKQAFYDCCHCGLCATHCEVDGVSLIAETRYLRAKLVRLGETLPMVRSWGEAYARTGHPPGYDPGLLRQIDHDDPAARTLVLVGAATVCHGMATVEACLAVARARGEAVTTLGESEGDAGGAALDLGFPDLARSQAERLALQVNAGPWERVLVLDPADASTMALDWPELGVTLSKPLVTWPAWLLEAPLPIDGEGAERVSYHDPCALSRGMGETMAARELIRLGGGELVEAVWSGAESRCCGGDGGLPVSNPELAAAIAADRAAQFRPLGVARVLTAGGTCAARLADALGPELPVEDIGVWWARRTLPSAPTGIGL